jgi:TPR repeat protein
MTALQQRNYQMQAACLEANQQGIMPDNCEQKPAAPQQVASVAPQQVAPKEDLQNTIGWFEKQAELGDVAAQNNLGVIYRRGTGIEKQPAKALTMFEKSAARGSVNGMLNLANMHKLGEGTEQNLEISYAWYNLAADRLPAGGKKKKALENIKEISGYMDNQQIGSALEYLTKLDETIPLLKDEE